MAGMLRVASTVTFREVPAITLDDDSRSECAAFWLHARSQNPALFDGPVMVAADVVWREQACQISFFESTYSRYLWARTARASWAAPALFASVMAVTGDGALLAGRMSASTSTPGRVQLPGGNVERAGAPTLSLASARQTAGRELAEEVGIHVPEGCLRLGHVKTGGDHGDVGIFFCVRLTETLSEVSQAFASHLHSLASAQSTAEFSHLVAFSRSSTSTPVVTAPFVVDYLEDAMRVALGLSAGQIRYAAPQGRPPGAWLVVVEDWQVAVETP